MKNLTPSFLPVLITVLMMTLFSTAWAQVEYYDQSHDGFLVFHPIRTDANGNILPWSNDEPGRAYDSVLNLVWNFWDTMRVDANGLPYYMNHQVWRPTNDPRGIAGSEFEMALSSWKLYYMYTGDERVKENMKFIADYYLTHSLSPADASWPDVPYPYNNFIYSGKYQGDMVIGLGYTQPDKAGSLASELVDLYKITYNEGYLDAAVRIATTLAHHVQPGNNDESPLPFKVNALTGEVGKLKSNNHNGDDVARSSYTSNWTGTMELFLKLQSMNKGETASYKKAFDVILDWMKTYPLKTNKWGPFFEDIPGWSDTQINAVTFARFMMMHPDLFPDWKKQVQGIFEWVYANLGNASWKKYGVTVVNEQTVYQTPGNSHTSREASTELMYASLTGDDTRVDNAIRQLNWATYMVDTDGKNCYPHDEVWMSDGYGDYVRHFLRAMAARPGLAPSNEDHILNSTSVIQQADYAPNFNKRLGPDVPRDEVNTAAIYYRTFDDSSVETIRMTKKPSRVKAGKEELSEKKTLADNSWTWEPLTKGGVLKVNHINSGRVTVYK